MTDTTERRGDRDFELVRSYEDGGKAFVTEWEMVPDPFGLGPLRRGRIVYADMERRDLTKPQRRKP